MTHSITFHALPTDAVRALQNGGPDFWGNPAERAISDGNGVPCRHCMAIVPEGAEYLIAAWRPFPDAQPYAEVGPIFLCADACTAPAPSPQIPGFLTSPEYLIKGYTADYRIRYGTGAIIPTQDIPQAAQDILNDPQVAFVDVRSARNNCYHTRITRG
ncbi:Protein of unknown function [Monaibacterium marinum]|uniref:DUF1203 domain-containing protein n=1 Tax=Pontivivens marinum TaxID=1690039 RepID=A0A2C9CQE6_9RHOB|nr:DUF1203 domain-containing protein [Monaibacterium marinum]SOH93482.1 Protein of unknown function [Monaibacterium marinum]